MNYLTDQAGKHITPKNPLDVRDVGLSTDSVTVSAESVTFITGAAGFSRYVRLDKAPIMNKTGDKVGSFWRSTENTVDSTLNTRYARNKLPVFSSITETDGSAACVLHNEVINMETLFETPSGTKDYVMVLRDPNGNTLYGWIGGISTSGSDYTFTITSTPAGSTQNWNGSQSSFDSTSPSMCRYEIYYYDTSFAWVTGTVLTNEIMYDPSRSDLGQLSTMANGDFAIDYRRGLILYKKATTGTSDTCNYITGANTSVTVGGSSGVTDDTAFTVGSTSVTPAGFMADETATDSVDEGDTGVARMTLDRKQITAGDYVDDTAFTPAGSGSYVHLIAGEADETGPDSVDEGDVGAIRMTLTRFLKVSLGDLLAGEDLTNNVHAVVVEPLAVSTHACSLDTSAAAEASSVTKASAGTLFDVVFSNANAAVRYIQFFNSTTVPADTTVPVITISCPAVSTVKVSWPLGRFFSTGIAWSNSTTQNTKTIGAADSLADVLFK